MISPRWTPGRSPEDDEDAERLESFPRQRSGTLIEKLLGILSGVMLAALVLSLVGQITGQSLLRRLFTGPLSGGPHQAPGRTPAHDAGTPPKQTSAPPKAATGQDRSDRPRSSATVRPSPSDPAPSKQVASTPPPEAATPKATPPLFAQSPRAELVRAPESRGWGLSYAVRLLDLAGRPMAGADVVLVAKMADGTVENIPMGALPEPGTYRGTVPTGRSTPVDLRVRVSTGDKFVEVLVRP
jgi:hypothetical protein